MRICTVFFTLLLFGLPVFSQQVLISFGELNRFAIMRSPEIRIIEENYNLNKIESKMDLQLSNPEINYSQEYVKSLSAKQQDDFLILNKQLELPWIYLLRRQSWNFMLKVFEYQKEEKIRNFIGEIKTGYIQIKILEEQVEHLKLLKQIITEMTETVQSQRKEGAISGVNQQLIQMALFNLSSSLLKVEQKKLSLEMEWKSRLGIEETQKIELISEIYFKPIVIDSVEYYKIKLANIPGFQRREKMVEALKRQIYMERLSIISNLNLFYGYKQTFPDFKGYTFGLSLAVPIFNRNQLQVQKNQSELNLTKSELAFYSLQVERQIKTKLKTIQDYLLLLENISPQFNSIQDLIEKTIFSYKEGWISLNEALNGIQIYSETIQQYYDRLADYYQNIFELEVIMDKQFVTF
jgi:outer membrane protein TolC